MRFSADHLSPDYRPDLMGRIEVFLDGARVTKVEAGDTEGGWIVQVVTNENGRPVVDPVNRDQFLRRTLRGKVEVKEK